MRLRPRVEPGRVAEIVAGDLGDRDAATRLNTHCDGREERLRQAIPGDAAHELRSDAVADGEQEHQEDRRLERLGDGDAELADQHARQQRRGDGSEADALERELAEVVADAQASERSRSPGSCAALQRTSR